MATSVRDSGRAPPAATDFRRKAETALRQLGYSIVVPKASAPVEPEFWVREPGGRHRTRPVFVGPTLPERVAREPARLSSPIVVVPSDLEAREAWSQRRRAPGTPVDAELSILVLPPQPDAKSEPHWHAGAVARDEVLRLATGIVVGLFRRSGAIDGGLPIDFEELLLLLRHRFGVDVHESLGVRSDEDALFVLYQLAQRDAYAPGDSGASLHTLVLRPTGTAARVPWFAG